MGFRILTDRDVRLGGWSGPKAGYASTGAIGRDLGEPRMS